ncbi:MAG: hypothetical protein AAGB04_26470 [Pseudomonadota bacterium]
MSRYHIYRIVSMKKRPRDMSGRCALLARELRHPSCLCNGIVLVPLAFHGDRGHDAVLTVERLVLILQEAFADG